MFLILSSIPLAAGVKCMTNSKNLTEQIDYKEWHSVACNCPCQVIKNGYCTECRHLQNADMGFISSTKQMPDKAYTVMKKLALDYLQQKKD